MTIYLSRVSSTDIGSVWRSAKVVSPIKCKILMSGGSNDSIVIVTCCSASCCDTTTGLNISMVVVFSILLAQILSRKDGISSVQRNAWILRRKGLGFLVVEIEQ